MGVGGGVIPLIAPLMRIFLAKVELVFQLSEDAGRSRVPSAMPQPSAPPASSLFESVVSSLVVASSALASNRRKYVVFAARSMPPTGAVKAHT